MPYFKAPDNSVHFMDESDIERGMSALLPVGSVAITEEEAEQLRPAPLPVTAPDPVEKLREFLAQNPDVVSLLT